MWLFPEEIHEALASGEAERVAGALQVLMQNLDDMDTFPLAPQEIDPVLASGLPEAQALQIVRLLASWPDWAPPLSEAERCLRLLSVVRASDGPSVCYRAALECRTVDDLRAAGPMLSEIAGLPVEERARLAPFIEDLLGGSPAFRAEVIARLGAR